MHVTRKASTDSAIVLLLGAVVTLIVVSVAISSCQEDVGLAEPSAGTVRLVAQAEEARRVLDEGRSYEEYALSLRVVTVSYDDMALHNAADTKARAMLKPSIECLQLAREAWQADIEGEWDMETYGSAQYWRALHPSAPLDLAEGELSVDEVITAALSCATEGLAEAAEMVSE